MSACAGPAAPGEASAWWRRRKENPGFRTQPYQQLASVYEAMGQEGQAREVRVEKERALRKYGNVSPRERVWSWFLDWTMLYGYAAWRALFVAGAMILLGWWIFASASASGAMRASKPAEAPRFQSFVYSVDTFVPVIDFGQQNAWKPSSDGSFRLLLIGLRAGTGWLQAYLWVHIGLGWLATTLAVASLTGLVRRE